MSEEYSKIKRRVKNVEEAVQILTELLLKADERMDQHPTWINQIGESQSEADLKIAALADAQIRTEEALARLAEAQAHTDTRLEALIDIVRQDRNGRQ